MLSPKLTPELAQHLESALAVLYDAQREASRTTLAAKIAEDEASAAAVAESEAKTRAAALLREAGFTNGVGEFAKAFTFRGAAWWAEQISASTVVRRVDVPSLDALGRSDLR
jgi:hypothetical protein